MRRYLTILSACFILILTGCSKEADDLIPFTPPLHVQQASIVWNNIVIGDITPVNAFESDNGGLMIFPYFNASNYILIEEKLLSNNGFWDSVTDEYVTTDNYIKGDGYSLFTTPEGITLSCIPLGDNKCYVVSTDTLSSAYVKKVCEIICQQLGL